MSRPFRAREQGAREAGEAFLESGADFEECVGVSSVSGKQSVNKASRRRKGGLSGAASGLGHEMPAGNGDWGPWTGEPCLQPGCKQEVVVHVKLQGVSQKQIGTRGNAAWPPPSLAASKSGHHHLPAPASAWYEWMPRSFGFTRV